MAHVRPVTGLFAELAAAESGWRLLMGLGLRPDEVSLLLTDQTHRLLATVATFARSDDAPSIAQAIGSNGATLPLAALGLLAAGPLALSLGDGRGESEGRGLLGTLIAWGTPEDCIRDYERGIRDGGVLIGVDPRSDEQAAQLETGWHALGARCIHRARPAPRPGARAGAAVGGVIQR